MTAAVTGAVWHPDHLVFDDYTPRLGEYSTALFSPDEAYRYALTRRWAGGRACAFVMLNPSTASAHVDDATIRRCVGYARRWGFASLLVLNLFAVRATDPKVMRAHPDPVGPDNDAVIVAALTSGAYDIGRVIVAWGTNGRHMGRDVAVTRLLRLIGIAPQCLDLTAAADPRHPLRLRSDLTPFEYPVSAS